MITETSIGSPYGFTGRRRDAESNLWHYRNRTYSSMPGRFLERDPAGFVDGLNLYAYVINNPLQFLDPFGLTKKDSNKGLELEADISFDNSLQKILQKIFAPTLHAIEGIMGIAEIFGNHKEK